MIRKHYNKLAHQSRPLTTQYLRSVNNQIKSHLIETNLHENKKYKWRMGEHQEVDKVLRHVKEAHQCGELFFRVSQKHFL